MANIVIRLPFPNVSDPTQPATLTMVDQGDGTFSPRVSAAGITTGAGTATIHGNGSTNGKKGSGIIVQDATTAADGKLQIETAGTFGTAGTIMQSDGTYGTWSGNIFGSAASVPVAFSQMLRYDSTAVTGGLYVWNGASYTKVSNVVA